MFNDIKQFGIRKPFDFKNSFKELVRAASKNKVRLPVRHLDSFQILNRFIRLQSDYQAKGCLYLDLIYELKAHNLTPQS
jgi:hypothetical protein